MVFYGAPKRIDVLLKVRAQGEHVFRFPGEVLSPSPPGLGSERDADTNNYDQDFTHNAEPPHTITVSNR